jgi:AraC-like DNA-binding protein
MKPFYEQIQFLVNKSFFLRKESGHPINIPFHYHPELELTYHYRNLGTRFIGTSVERMEVEDLTFLGTNLPHAFISDQEFKKNPCRHEAKSLVLQFNSNIFGPPFMDLPEMLPIRRLLIKSQQGMSIQGKTKTRLIEKFKELPDLKGMPSIFLILDILQDLATTEEYRLLSKKGADKKYHSPDYYRLNTVHNFIFNHFKEDIKLADAAKVANMTPTAFCRYLKKHTLKTFVQIMTETRIEYACNLLQTDTNNIQFIAEQSGFQNLSNFNKQFKKHCNITPLQYRKSYLSI